MGYLLPDLTLLSVRLDTSRRPCRRLFVCV